MFGKCRLVDTRTLHWRGRGHHSIDFIVTAQKASKRITINLTQVIYLLVFNSCIQDTAFTAGDHRVIGIAPHGGSGCWRRVTKQFYIRKSAAQYVRPLLLGTSVDLIKQLHDCFNNLWGRFISAWKYFCYILHLYFSQATIWLVPSDAINKDMKWK